MLARNVVTGEDSIHNVITGEDLANYAWRLYETTQVALNANKEIVSSLPDKVNDFTVPQQKAKMIEGFLKNINFNAYVIKDCAHKTKAFDYSTFKNANPDVVDEAVKSVQQTLNEVNAAVAEESSNTDDVVKAAAAVKKTADAVKKVTDAMETAADAKKGGATQGGGHSPNDVEKSVKNAINFAIDATQVGGSSEPASNAVKSALNAARTAHSVARLVLNEEKHVDQAKYLIDAINKWLSMIKNPEGARENVEEVKKRMKALDFPGNLTSWFKGRNWKTLGLKADDKKFTSFAGGQIISQSGGAPAPPQPKPQSAATSYANTIKTKHAEHTKKIMKSQADFYAKLEECLNTLSTVHKKIDNVEKRAEIEQMIESISDKIKAHKQKINSLYELKYSLLEMIIDSQFYVIYVIKALRILFAYVALFLTTRMFVPIYEDIVYDAKKDPPGLWRFMLIYLAFDVSLNVFLLVLLFLLKYLFKTDDNTFIVDSALIGNFLLDYVVGMFMTMVIGVLVGRVIIMKKYFKYKYEGVRAIRAFESIVFWIAVVNILIPYYLIF